ncbi:unnamed protein product [Euphydryas editha]|uniref:UDP-glucuronosyltransferase n=1 Tax=Euphydryas editha TaxID=104508 RepID=A0AAU9U7J2_EUPED|nr:unnamed protein product [Euphydryas editha]
MLLKYLSFLTLLKCCYAYKILYVSAVPSKSHGILTAGYVRHLLEAGHEVTNVSPFPVNNPSRNLRNIDISEIRKFIDMSVIDVDVIMNKKVDIQDQIASISITENLWKDTVKLDVMQKLMNDPREKFDVIVAEWLYSDLVSGLASVFNCPLIWASTMDPHSLVLSLIHENLNPAYTIHHTSVDYSFTFLDRIYQLMSTSRVWYYKWINANKESEVFKQLYGSIVAKKGRVLPPYDDVRYNASLMLGNSHVITGDSIALPQNYKHIGGYHIKDTVEPLPQNLKEIFDNSSNGVIYFSLGSNLKSSSLPESIKRDLVQMFSEFKETVIWKFEKSIPDLPQNVHIIPWIPQQSVLSHPKCKLFITHGGLLSKLEALHAGKPIIGIPFFADQYINVNRAVAKGFAKRINFGKNIPRELRIAIKEMLENYSYQNRAKELSKIFHDRILPPGKELVYWIEHVIRTNGAPHLRSIALNVSWYQKLYLDLLLVIILILTLLFVICKYIFTLIRIRLRSKRKIQ